MTKNAIPTLNDETLAALIGEAAYVGHGLEANHALVTRGGTVYDVVASLGEGIDVRLGSYRTRECADRHGKEFCLRVFEACDGAGIELEDEAIGFQCVPRRVYQGTLAPEAAPAKAPKKAKKQPTVSAPAEAAPPASSGDLTPAVEVSPATVQE